MRILALMLCCASVGCGISQYEAEKQSKERAFIQIVKDCVYEAELGLATQKRQFDVPNVADPMAQNSANKIRSGIQSAPDIRYDQRLNVFRKFVLELADCFDLIEGNANAKSRQDAIDLLQSSIEEINTHLSKLH